VASKFQCAGAAVESKIVLDENCLTCCGIDWVSNDGLLLVGAALAFLSTAVRRWLGAFVRACRKRESLRVACFATARVATARRNIETAAWFDPARSWDWSAGAGIATSFARCSA
jgi:hypothetical protein